MAKIEIEGHELKITEGERTDTVPLWLIEYVDVDEPSEGVYRAKLVVERGIFNDQFIAVTFVSRKEADDAARRIEDAL